MTRSGTLAVPSGQDQSGTAIAVRARDNRTAKYIQGVQCPCVEPNHPFIKVRLFPPINNLPSDAGIPRQREMASQLETPKVPLRMRRSQTSLPKITTSSPSAPPPNEPQTSKEGHSHKSHHHHHHWYAKDTIQSAIQLQNPFSFQDGRKQHSKHDQRTPAASEPGSRRPSVTPAKDANEENSTVKPVTQEDVFRERAKAKMREEYATPRIAEFSKR